MSLTPGSNLAPAANPGGQPPFLVRAKGTGNLSGDRWVSQERGSWGLWAQDEGNFLHPSLPPLSSWLLIGGHLQHFHHLLPDFRNQERAELIVVSGQLGDAAQGLSKTRSVQLGGLVEQGEVSTLKKASKGAAILRQEKYPMTNDRVCPPP